MKHLFLPLCLLAYSTAAVRAQMTMSADTLIEVEQQHSTSGTSIEPASTPVPMMMSERHGWQLMLHGNGFVGDVQQQAVGERGRDAFFSTNWVMPMAQRPLGPGQLTVRAMLSLEPATVGARAYPELFQQGETAFGKPIVDGQHPHDFVMELGALYDLPVAHYWLLSLYAAPVGDPALGPTAYPHRMSASEDPVAALGHHQEDSTHIAFNVVTGGVTFGWVRAEVSGFHGGEPDEHRWALQPSPNGHAIDSASGRVTVSPTKDWTGQYSVGHIHAPEALYPGEDQQRQTASVMWHHAFKTEAAAAMAPMPPGQDMKMDGNMAGMDMGAGSASSSGSMQGMAGMAMPGMSMAVEPRMDLATTVLWGRTKSLADGSKENSYLAEALLRFGKNYAWTRLENAGRSNELELTPGSAVAAGFVEAPVGHVAAYTLGYDRDFAVGKHLLAAPGVQGTVYRTPVALRGVYGDTPTGVVMFVRFRLR
jgi:hypothetical protein